MSAGQVPGGDITGRDSLMFVVRLGFCRISHTVRDQKDKQE